MIGEVWTVLIGFYDVRIHRMNHKARPALVIAQADSDDYVILPISSVSRRENLDPLYDVEVDPAQYPLLGFPHLSYIRTHKQTTVHIGEMGSKKSDLRGTYPDLFLDVIAKREQFSNEITRQAIEE